MMAAVLMTAELARRHSKAASAMVAETGGAWSLACGGSTSSASAKKPVIKDHTAGGCCSKSTNAPLALVGLRAAADLASNGAESNGPRALATAVAWATTRTRAGCRDKLPTLLRHSLSPTSYLLNWRC